jgi:predicted dehydrogenase
VVSAQAVEGPPGIDVEMTAVLSFPGGATGRIHCGMSAGIEVALSLEVVGSAGKLSVRNPIHPYAGHELQLETESGSATSSVDGDTTYAHQLEAFCSSVRDGTPLPTGGRDAIETMRVIEAVYAKAGLPPRGGAPGNDQGRTSKRSSR